MSVWLWALVGLAAWIAVILIAIAFGKAASKPWPSPPPKPPEDEPEQRPFYAPFAPADPTGCTCIDPFSNCPIHG